MSLTFSGNPCFSRVHRQVYSSISGYAIYIIGNTLNDHGRYLVELDGEMWMFNGTSLYAVEGATLFVGTGLDPESVKTIVVTNLDEGKFLDIGYAVIVGPDASISSSGRLESLL